MLKASIMRSDGTFERFQLNSRRPVPFETELFSGMLAIRARMACATVKSRDVIAH